MEIHAPTIEIRLRSMLTQAMASGEPVLFDPERPQLDPNALLRERGGRITDPASVNWNCPLCYKTMSYDLFVAHARGCFRRYGSLLDPTLKQYKGVSLAENSD